MKVEWLMVTVLCYLTTTLAVIVEATLTDVPQLEKRREKIVNPNYQKLMDDKNAAENPQSTAEEGPKPWVRVYSSTITEIVTPTVIAGVTFSAKTSETNGLEPWISLNKDGAPKTIKPQLKGGGIKNSSPLYGTYFATPTTVTYNKEQLKAHNMADDEIFTEVNYIPESKEAHELNPLIRCTPNGYFKKGMANNIVSEPFCFPRDNSKWYKDKTYFITWYSKFFGQEVESVRVHLFHIKLTQKQKGYSKRDYIYDFFKRSSLIEGGASPKGEPFYSSGWLSKDQGYFPVTVEEEWIGKNEFKKQVLVAIQPDNVALEEFDLLDRHLVVSIQRGATVAKPNTDDIKKLEEKQRNRYLYGEIEEGIDTEKYLAIMTLPTVVIFVAFCMWLYVQYNQRDLDFSHVKRRKPAGKSTTKKMLSFKSKKAPSSMELPQFQSKND